MKKIILFLSLIVTLLLMSSCEKILKPGCEQGMPAISEKEFKKYTEEIKKLKFELYSRKYYLDSILIPREKKIQQMRDLGGFVSPDYIKKSMNEKTKIKTDIYQYNRDIRNLQFCIEKNVSMDRETFGSIFLSIIIWGTVIFLFLAFCILAAGIGNM